MKTQILKIKTAFYYALMAVADFQVTRVEGGRLVWKRGGQS